MQKFNIDTEILLKFDDDGFEVVLSIEEARALYHKLGMIFDPQKLVNVYGGITSTITKGSTIGPNGTTWMTWDGSGLTVK